MQSRMKKLAIMLLVGCLMLVAISTVSADNPVEVSNYAELNGNVSAGHDVVLKNNITPDAGESFGGGINVNQNVTVDGKGFCIDARQTGRIFQIINNDVVLTLKNITLKNGYTTDKGGAIYSAFDVNIIANDNVCFINNTADKDGGAIYSEIGLVNITSRNGNVTFENNKAGAGGNGGAIYAKTNVIINFWGDICFNNNTAGNSGGAIYADIGLVNITGRNGNVTFENNKGNNNLGGAIRAKTNVIIDFWGDICFNNNTAGYGGAINSKGMVNITGRNGNVTFENNKAVAGGNGGAIIADTNVIIDSYGGVYFNNNTANYAGAICSGNITISTNNEDIIFDNNIASYGGAIDAWDDSGYGYVSIIAINGIVCFKNNKANKTNSGFSGGAILDDSGSESFVILLKGEKVIFDNNTANGTGGAIQTCGSVNITAGSVEFTNNKALTGDGGAIRACGEVIIKAAEDIIFTDNFANSTGTNDLGGAAISAYKNNNYYNVTLTSANGKIVFRNNTAGNGGAILGKNVNITAKNVEFKNNKATNDDGWGGAIYAEGDVIIKSYYDVIFYNNTADWGGAIDTKNIVNIISNYGSITFENNKANNDGGAIYAEGDVIIKSYDVIFYNNTADWGGAIYSHSGMVNITSTNGGMTFENNKAINTGGDGGAIRAGSDVIIKSYGNILFNNNTAGKTGGAIFSGANVNITSKNGTVTFENNKVTSTTLGTGYGGAIYAYTLGYDVIIKSCYDVIFYNNTGNYGGAICSFADVNITSTNSSITFENNKASMGGAIYAVNDVIIKSYGNILFNNNTGDQCGAIFSGADVNITSTNGSITFENNKAIATGGAGGVMQAVTDVIIKSYGNILFNNNTGDYAGAIFSGADVNITSTNGSITFENNKALNDGGAIYSMGKVNLNNTIFINNDAGNGSTIYSKDIELNNSIIKSNSNNSPIYVTGIASFNNNTFKLANKTIAPIAFNGTSITSNVVAIVYYNNTEYAKLGSKTQINVTFFDDMGNIIAILNNTLSNVTLNSTIFTGYLVNNGLKSNVSYNANTADKFLISVISEGLSNLTVKTAILIVNGKNNTDVDISGVLNATAFNGNITIILNENTTGIVTITFNGTDYNATLNKGKVVITIPGLIGGDVPILFNYTGDTQFNPIERNYVVEIAKIIGYGINVTGKVNNDLVTGVVNITLPKDANGNITVIINGTSFNGIVINGKVSLDVTELIEGENNITVIYYNDLRYNDTIRKNTIKVDPVNSFIILQDLINKNNYLILKDDYVYIKERDNGSLIINKNITIDGAGYTLDGKNLVNIFKINKNAKLTLKNIKLENALRYSIINNGVLDLTNITSKTPIYNNGVITSGVKFIVISNKITTYDSFVVVLKTNDGIPIINSDNIVFGDDQGHTYKTYIYYKGAYICYVPSGITGNVTFNNVNLTDYTNLTSKGSLNITEDPKTTHKINNLVNTVKSTITTKVVTKLPALTELIKSTTSIVKKSLINVLNKKVLSLF